VSDVVKRYVFFHRPAVAVPLFLESVGTNPDQEPIHRPRGYGHFHWLQTLGGTGEVEVDGRSQTLVPGEGFLLPPGLAHSYRALGPAWKTAYLTFHGDLAHKIVEGLGLEVPGFYRWTPPGPLDGFVPHFLCSQLSTLGTNPWTDSAEIYRFLALLRTLGSPRDCPSLEHRLERLQPLFDLLEERYADPDFDVATMARLLDVTPRHMNDLVRRACGDTPYQYLVKLRVRKAKELLVSAPELSVKDVSLRVGFRAPSHFVATFRTLVGLPPDYFRKTMNDPAPALKVSPKEVSPEPRDAKAAALRTSDSPVTV
jgi:AraC-like DNA-binding protein